MQEKKEGREEEVEKKAERVRRESEVWGIVNEERKRKNRRINETIEMREWKKYFMNVLGGNREKSEERDRGREKRLRHRGRDK